MKKTITALVAATALTLTACGKDTVEPEKAHQVLVDSGVNMPFKQFEDQSGVVCDLFEKGHETYDVVNTVARANKVSTEDALATVAAMRNAYCPL